MAGQSQNGGGCRLVVSGVVQSVRPWVTKDTPPQSKLSIDLAWFGGHYELTVDAGDASFSKVGIGQEISVAIPFVEHPKFGWRGRGAPALIKAGA